MSSLVTVSQFNTYSGNFEDDADSVSLKQTCLDSAENIVTQYLGYNPSSQSYEQFVSGIGDYKLYLNSRPITGVNYLKIGDEEIDLTQIECKDNYIYETNRNNIFKVGVDNIYIEYTGGQKIIPQLIVLTILRIASLMLMETNGNIGLSGKSFSDSSRSFVSYSNYQKYLQPLNSLCIMRF